MSILTESAKSSMKQRETSNAIQWKYRGVTFDDTEKRFVFDFEHDGAEDIGLSIQRAVDSAHKKINLYHYGIVVMPENRTKINQYMLRYIYRFNQPRLCNVKRCSVKFN